jgi:ureidoglycolate hydrolase
MSHLCNLLESYGDIHLNQALVKFFLIVAVQEIGTSNQALLKAFVTNPEQSYCQFFHLPHRSYQ